MRRLLVVSCLILAVLVTIAISGCGGNDITGVYRDAKDSSRTLELKSGGDCVLDTGATGIPSLNGTYKVEDGSIKLFEAGMGSKPVMTLRIRKSELIDNKSGVWKKRSPQ